MKRTFLSLFLSLFLSSLTLLSLTAPAWGGGWAVITLDELPAQVVAGQPLVVSFAVRQHGERLMEDLDPRINLTHSQTRETFTVNARPKPGEPGHYAATITFPQAGEWDWHIDAFWPPQPMPRLNVLAAAPAPSAGSAHASASTAGNTRASTPMMIGGLALAVALGALVALVRTRAAWAAGLMLAAALVSTVGLVSAAKNGSAAASLPLPTSPVEHGQALFIAKGCIVCHDHAAVSEYRRAFADFSIGPNLTHWAVTPDFLQKWLRDPAAIRPGTQMPALGLKDDEVNALIVFLTAGN